MKEENKTLNQAIRYARYQKDRNWRNFKQCKSLLEKALSDLSQKSEEELSKKDLLYLISCNCDYMRSLSLYKYYKDELSNLLVKANSEGAEYVND